MPGSPQRPEPERLTATCASKHLLFEQFGRYPGTLSIERVRQERARLAQVRRGRKPVCREQADASCPSASCGLGGSLTSTLRCCTQARDLHTLCSWRSIRSICCSSPSTG